jgi:hypothetical protein
MEGTTTTTAKNNSGNTFINNNIYDFFGATVKSAGIYIGTGNTDINITNNRFYQTAARTQTLGRQHSAVWINNPSGNNFQITGNTIGYAAAGGTGTYTFVGVGSSQFVPIDLYVGSTTATSVQGNTIAGIALSGSMSGTTTSAPFRGIHSQGLTTIGDVTGNTIGSLSATGSITFTSTAASGIHIYGIYIGGSYNCTTNNNSVGGITASSSPGSMNIYGLYSSASSTTTWTCNGSGTCVEGPSTGGIVVTQDECTSTCLVDPPPTDTGAGDEGGGNAGPDGPTTPGGGSGGPDTSGCSAWRAGTCCCVNFGFKYSGKSIKIPSKLKKNCILLVF